MVSVLWQAARFAEEKHQGQVRQGGEPHLYHVLRVGQAAGEWALQHRPNEAAVLVLCGVLHDILEDTETTDEELAGLFGVEVARAVRALSHVEEEEPEAVYLRRVAKGGPVAVVVKRCDRLDNFACLPQAPKNFRDKVIRLQTEALPIWYEIDPDGAPEIEVELERLRTLEQE